MKVIRVSEQGFCKGVRRALSLVEMAITENSEGKQIYILGDIINNRFVSEQFKKQGVITISSNNQSRLEMVKLVSKDSIVILTAHGVSPEVLNYLKNNKIEYIDASCPFVIDVHNRITKHLDQDFEIIYIGKHNHPESEGVLGINRRKIHIVTNVEDVRNLKVKSQNILIDTQTTLSNFYTKPIIDEIFVKYPEAILASGVCDATTKRQEALINEIKGDLCIVVGDVRSSNANELLKIGLNYMPTYLINSVEEIKKEWLDGVKVITLTSAASTPSILTDEIYEYLINYNTWLFMCFFYSKCNHFIFN